jgi:hypothetical protein
MKKLSPTDIQSSYWTQKIEFLVKSTHRFAIPLRKQTAFCMLPAFQIIDSFH